MVGPASARAARTGAAPAGGETIFALARGDGRADMGDGVGKAGERERAPIASENATNLIQPKTN